MKRFLFIIPLFLLYPALSHGEMTQKEIPKVEEAQGEATQVEVSKGETGTREWGVALGLRSTYYRMTQNTGHIFGTINWLEENQNYWPIKPVVQVNFLKYLALEFSYDQFKVTALCQGLFGIAEHDPNWADGAVKWAPITMALQFRWPHFHKSLVPYVLGGISYTKTSWDRNEWYYYGFPSLAEYNSWTSQGNRPEDYPNSGYRRIFEVDDHTIGTLLGVGVDYFIWKNLALNLDWRYYWSKVGFTYTLAYDGGRDVVRVQHGTFFLDSWIIGLGIKYFF